MASHSKKEGKEAAWRKDIQQHGTARVQTFSNVHVMRRWGFEKV